MAVLNNKQIQNVRKVCFISYADKKFCHKDTKDFAFGKKDLPQRHGRH